MAGYDFKITILGIGGLMWMAFGILLFMDHPILCMGCNSSQEPYHIIGSIGFVGTGIGILLVIISFIIPGKRLEDDYSHSPLGKESTALR